ncbi:hypothetical protein ACWN83_05130 [Pseudolactococcus plantarum]|uniref:Uncharacterized protein n=1 Tax=Pseudolactococcus plantarum TaxID=1365 RepID=A0A2A5RZG7_9LACT|nr:hypothetical protein [Lactococcus plantarum]PCS06642.1 hypothetical protein RU87_GL001495 [Lactococcus plantarum]HCN75211.1 hypothetical protein [Lactococcus sp.]
MNQVKQFLSKFNLVMNPLKLLKLYRQMDSLIKDQQNDYPSDPVSNALFLKIDARNYYFKHKKWQEIAELPLEANLIVVSKKSVDEAMKIVGKSKDDDINVLFSALKRVDEFTIYQSIFDALSGDFSTNVTIKQLMKLVLAKK